MAVNFLIILLWGTGSLVALIGAITGNPDLSPIVALLWSGPAGGESWDCYL